METEYVLQSKDRKIYFIEIQKRLLGKNTVAISDEKGHKLGDVAAINKEGKLELDADLSEEAVRSCKGMKVVHMPTKRPEVTMYVPHTESIEKVFKRVA